MVPLQNNIIIDNKNLIIMILITGATGGFGNTIIDYLLRSGFPKNQIAALANNRRSTPKQVLYWEVGRFHIFLF